MKVDEQLARRCVQSRRYSATRKIWFVERVVGKKNGGCGDSLSHSYRTITPFQHRGDAARASTIAESHGAGQTPARLAVRAIFDVAVDIAAAPQPMHSGAGWSSLRRTIVTRCPLRLLTDYHDRQCGGAV